eukprot:TRINITY_DN6601_c0_g1_i1.p1 TRINITY_DN6601_c0_g1~~TRINITY_DN6601_c0_g1_i1.p1  ORF type:complete len:181 (-),score=36.31 TRINITY_DN6601_c0_g1_i1:101-643(-)
MQEGIHSLLLLLEEDEFLLQAYLCLALMCSLSKYYTQALQLLILAENAYPNEEQILDLRAQINSKLSSFNNESYKGLIDEEGEMTEELITSLEELFIRFDEDKDGLWSIEEFEKFVALATGAPCPPDFRKWVFKTFAVSPKFLSLSSFLHFYKHQTVEDPSESRADLGKFGFQFTPQKKE